MSLLCAVAHSRIQGLVLVCPLLLTYQQSLLGSQAESLWLHLPIITELASMCHKVFEGGSVQYAYTTIPTYPRSAICSCTVPALLCSCWPM